MLATHQGEVLEVKASAVQFLNLPDPLETKFKRFPAGTEVWKLYRTNLEMYMSCQDKQRFTLYGPITQREWDEVKPFPI